MTVSPRITVITVVYNRREEIEATVRSVINLAYADVEYIIIDGGSTDGTLEVLKKYDRISILVSEPDGGIYDAMNKGVRLATGDWIVFMNSGDCFADKEALGFFTREKLDGVAVVYGDVCIRYHSFDANRNPRPLGEFWKHMPFSHQACFVRREIFNRYVFDTSYRLSADFEFLYRTYLANEVFRYVPVLISTFDYRQGASVSNAFRSIRERRDIVMKYTPSWKVRLYYFYKMTYVASAAKLKKLLGHDFSEWLIRSLKR